MKKILAIPLLLLALQSCTPSSNTPDSVLGYAPVYAADDDLKTIEGQGVTPFTNPGKIYAYGNYSLQVDNGLGIHIINSADPSNPQKIGFIQVKGCSEVSIKNNILYTNNMTDLVSINISDLNNVVVESRIQDAFPLNTLSTPPIAGVYFECVDNEKGTVIGWTQQQLEKPKCYRP